MKDLFVPKELSIKLKLKGFNEPCLFIYRGGDLYCSGVGGYLSDMAGGKNNEMLDEFLVNQSKGNEHYWVTAPLWQQVIEFLQEKYIWIYQDPFGWHVLHGGEVNQRFEKKFQDKIEAFNFAIDKI